jgi:hypothetical protein
LENGISIQTGVLVGHMLPLSDCWVSG